MPNLVAVVVKKTRQPTLIGAIVEARPWLEGHRFTQRETGASWRFEMIPSQFIVKGSHKTTRVKDGLLLVTGLLKEGVEWPGEPAKGL